MTQEDKELLLKDLCARLPYEPMCEFTDIEDEIVATAKLGYSLRDFVGNKVIIKPYLRPMSSMTLDEVKEHNNYVAYGTNHAYVDYTDWLNAHHFDYRGLIEKGLAIEVTEENNPYK